MRPCRRGTPPPHCFFLFWLFLIFVLALFVSSLLQSSWGGLPSSLFHLQGLVCPYLNPHFYHEMREANLLMMLGMLAGHAGDVENDADDVGGLA